MKPPLDRVDHRKEVWRAVRDRNLVISLVPIDFRLIQIQTPGLLIFEDERDYYCDGRTESLQFCCLLDGRRTVIFIPFMEKTVANSPGPDPRTEPETTKPPAADQPPKPAANPPGYSAVIPKDAPGRRGFCLDG